MERENDWKGYRTRYVVRARQLTEKYTTCGFTGREQTGNPGDYLVECSDGTLRISPRRIFEDLYVEFEVPSSSSPQSVSTP